MIIPLPWNSCPGIFKWIAFTNRKSLFSWMALIGYTCCQALKMWTCMCMTPAVILLHTHWVWGVHTLLVYTIWDRQSVCQICGFHNSPPRYERNHELIWFVRQFLQYGCIFVEVVNHIKRACDVNFPNHRPDYYRQWVIRKVSED